MALPIPVTGKEDDRNEPVAFVELIGADGSLGTWMASTQVEEMHMPQHFTYGGRSWKIAFRSARRYLPFSLTLLKFSHDIYPGTDIPKNFSSKIRLNPPDGEGREVLIYMNNPLRTAGLTFFQKSFANEDRTTVLQVVRNPGWQIPYLACSLMALGLVLQFGLHLAGFARRQRAAARPPPDRMKRWLPSSRPAPRPRLRRRPARAAAAIPATSISSASAACPSWRTAGSSRWTRLRAVRCSSCTATSPDYGRRQPADGSCADGRSSLRTNGCSTCFFRPDQADTYRLRHRQSRTCSR